MTGRWTVAGAALAMACALAGPAAAEDGGFLNEGWWVVLGARAAVDGNDPGDPALTARLAACDVEPFADFSTKFDGMRPGLVVVVHMQAYPSKVAAADRLAEARRCVPDAYLKRARYAGE